jgi:hypothetical protein
VVLYDQEWAAVAQAAGTQGEYQFQDVAPGAYHLVAYNDELETWAAKDIEVQPAQTLKVALYLKRAATQSVKATVNALAPETAIGVHRSRAACGGAVGDGRMLKVYPVFGQTIIYMQCGRVAYKIQGGGCAGCGVSGGWRYQNECQKSTPIYVHLPCPRARH